LRNSSWLISRTCRQNKRPCQTCSPAEFTARLREGTGKERAHTQDSSLFHSVRELKHTKGACPYTPFIRPLGSNKAGQSHRRRLKSFTDYHSNLLSASITAFREQATAFTGSTVTHASGADKKDAQTKKKKEQQLRRP
jgi:hypothetical protein